MKAHPKAMIAALALALAVVCLVFWWDPMVGVSAPTQASEQASSQRPKIAGVKTQAKVDEQQADASTQRQLAGGSSTESVSSHGDSAQLVVTARCVDGKGKPLPATFLVASQVDGTPRAVADGGGHVELTVAWPAKLTEGNEHFLVVVVSGEGLTRLTHQLSVDRKIVAAKEVQTFSLGDVVLEPGGAITGVVRDSNGAALQGARIWAAAPVKPAQGQTEERRRVFGRGFTGLGAGIWSWGEADVEGRYRLSGLPAGSVCVVARHPGCLCSYTPPVTVVANHEVSAPPLILAAVPGKNLIRGWVHGDKGQPLAGASISVFANRGARNIDPQTYARSVGQDASFEAVVMSNESYTLEVKHREQRSLEVLVHDVVAGTNDLVVQFVPGKEFEVVVTGPGGVPVAAPSATARDERGNWLELASPNGKDGKLQLAAPSQKFRLWVRGPGFLAKSLGPFEPTAVPERLEVELQPEGGVTGRVLANGQPVVGARVHLHFINPRSKFFRFAHKVFTRLEGAMRTEVHTDAAGKFRLPVRRSGVYVIHATAEGHAQGESAELTLTPGATAPLVDVVLTKPAAIVGRVLTGPSTDASGQILAATRGDGHVEVCVSEAGGAYRFDGLMPGGWQVRVCRPDDQRWLQRARTWPDRSIKELPVDVRIVAGETATYDVDLRSREGAEIRGRLSIDGIACNGWRVSLWRDGEYLFTKTDGNGAFTQRGAVGETTIHFFGSLPAGGQLHVRQALTLTEGVTPIAVALETGGIDLLSLPPPAKPPEEGRPEGYALVWDNATGPSFVYRFDADAAGNHRVAALPVGVAQLRRRQGDRTRVQGWQRIADVTITAGQHVQVTPK